MWRWQNLVVVLTGSSGQQRQSVLAGLDASTGRARWTLRVGGFVPHDGFSPTADGGLAISVDGDGVVELEVADLSSGRVRWTRPVGSDPVPPVAVGHGAVLFAGGADGDANSSLTSYDDRTGRIRWTEALKPWIDPQPPLQESAGLVYLQAEVLNSASGSFTSVLLGVSAADGRVKWRYSPREGLDLDAPGLISVGTSLASLGTSLDELDPATGRVRWHVAPPNQAIATGAGIIVIAASPASSPAAHTDQISVLDTLTGQTRWTAELNEPLAADSGQISPVLPVFLAGPLLVVPAASPEGSEMLGAFRMSDGQRAWQLVTPGLVEAPPSAAPGGMLVYAVG